MPENKVSNLRFQFTGKGMLASLGWKKMIKLILVKRKLSFPKNCELIFATLDINYILMLNYFLKLRFSHEWPKICSNF